MRPDPSDIAARRRRNSKPKRGSTSQPLKPIVGSRAVSSLALGLVILTTLTIVGLNRNDIGNYINRPMTKVRMDNQWQQVSEAELGRMINAYMGAGFFNFDVSGVKQTLESHAWIEEASIKRIWPDSLSISLTEHVAIARWGDDQLLNQYGELISPNNVERMTSLPLLDGPDGSQVSVMEQYQMMNQLLLTSGLRMSGITLSERGSWELSLNDSMLVTVGREQIVERLQRFIDFYEGQPVEETVGISAVDLRYDNGIAIRNSRDELAEVAVR